MDKYFAKAKEVNILHVSTGCKFIKPSGIQLFDPLTVFPIKKVATINKIPVQYNIIGVAVKNLLSASIMKVAIKMQAKR